jgi:hypothetical protein
MYIIIEIPLSETVEFQLLIQTGKKKKCERIFDALKVVTGHGLFSTPVTGQVEVHQGRGAPEDLPGWGTCSFRSCGSMHSAHESINTEQNTSET